MAGTGIGESIFYVGAIILAIGFVGVFGAVVIQANQDLEAHGQRASESLRSELTILDDPEQIDTSPISLHAKNTGTREVATETVNVIVNGQVSGDVTFDVLGSSDDTLWQPGQVLKITINDLALQSGANTLRVQLASGPDDQLEVVA